MSPAASKSSDGLSKEERDAVKERAGELKSAGSRKGSGKAAAEEKDCAAKIAEMAQPDRGIAERVHAVIRAVAPELAPRTWYGQPAYAKDGKVVCFFRSGKKDGVRYSTFAFNDTAALDEGNLWPTSYAVTKVGKAEEAVIADLVTKAVR